jgi:hypothetical protein
MDGLAFLANLQSSKTQMEGHLRDEPVDGALGRWVVLGGKKATPALPQLGKHLMGFGIWHGGGPQTLFVVVGQENKAAHDDIGQMAQTSAYRLKALGREGLFSSQNITQKCAAGKTKAARSLTKGYRRTVTPAFGHPKPQKRSVVGGLGEPQVKGAAMLVHWRCAL